MNSISEILADYYLHLGYEHLPEETISKAKQCVLDYLGCAIGGANLQSSTIIKNCFMPKTGAAECTVILGGKSLCDKAAFINAAYSHGLEMDDVNYGAGGHPAVAIIPTAFAVAEKQDSSGLDLLIAVIMGYDLMYRIGRAANPDSQFKRGLHPTSINGTFGAAMAAAKLLRLNKVQIANALGIAGSFTSGNLECYADGSLTKRINPGVAAQGGVMSAELAAGGYTGPRWIFEGRSGFLTTYSDDANSALLTEDLDYKHYGIMKTGFKPYANCRYNHSPIFAVLKLRSSHNIDFKEIDQVEVKVIGMAVRAVCEPKEVKYNPQNIVDAQFSLPYSVAVALVKGRAFTEEYTQEMLYNSEVRSLMPKIKMAHSTELDKLAPQTFPSEVTIRLNNGQEYYERVDYCKGDPEEPLSKGEMEEKFIALSRLNITDEKRLAKIIDSVWKLDQKKTRELVSLLNE